MVISIGKKGKTQYTAIAEEGHLLATGKLHPVHIVSHYASPSAVIAVACTAGFRISDINNSNNNNPHGTSAAFPI
ncbi:MAG: hypothetical protein REI95_09980 [Oxalicibacterium faecigallinarum]|uniref:hypothetical protein n=1 Tax=Oxalicibacterium faecigallinarum TaxID=573741 RepID=UPI002809FFE7|nr:hypothetical protein [Oxalicibacterium faecigallinarum]MDQ7969960.1 hypothetical protein [Oxalicibacterium faecigallinarum]